jgi:hypothetical protein
MDRRPQAICRKCGYPIEVVTSMMPVGDQPGVFAWVCDHCGDADSVLTYRIRQSWATTQTP